MTPIVRHLWEALFGISGALLFYVYAGYPFLIGFLSAITPSREKPLAKHEPTVTFLISAYNEHPVMRAKLENCLTVDYPRNLLEIIVISDCSTDGTDEIVQSYRPYDVRLVRQRKRLGKSAGLNLGVPQAHGEILLFSDANALYLPDAVRQLVRHFSDPQVGYVVGNARYVEKASASQAANAEGFYWKLETWLKKKESRFHSVVGGDGAIYAIRKELFSPLLDTDINDFVNPLQIVDQGYSGVFEPRAISYEETAASFAKEFRRKVRIISRSLNALGRVPGVLNPLRNPRHWFMLMSHKVLRWFAPLFMVAMMIASLALWNLPLFRLAVFLQAGFYALALVGWMLQGRDKTWWGFSFAFYFCVVNAASLVGCMKCWRGDLSGTWVPPRQNASSSA
jgi:cellulose synthase/poly-beta-1,6-N-acetylglucosamine synthase-like glycosyltransferase